MTSTGTVVQNFSSLKYSTEAFAPDHLSFVGENLNNFNGFDVYAITVTSTNGTITIGASKTGTIVFASGFTQVVSPAYSPDGTQIVFVGLTNDSRSMGTYVIAANGKSAEKDLYPEPGYGSGSILVYGSDPHFTANGGSIYFDRYVNGQFQIWKMNAADGSDQTAVIDAPGAISPFPTADGKYLMFQMGNDIYQANSDGSGAELVIQTGTLEAISPDGKRVIYLVNDPNVGGHWFLWTANVDGTDKVQITPSSGTILPEGWGN
jgi:TolB protein